MKRLFPITGILFILGIFLLPQILLHMKSGIYERYLLPAIMAYTFLMVLAVKYSREKGLKQNENQRQASPGSKKGFKILYLLMVVLLVPVVLAQLRVARYTALGFAAEGRNTGAWLTSIKDNTRPEDFILVVCHPLKHFEDSLSLKYYLETAFNLKNLFFAPANLKLNGSGVFLWTRLNQDFIDAYGEYQPAHEPDRYKFQAILIFPGQEQEFLRAAAWFKPGEYQRYANDGGYIGYYHH